MFKRKNYIGKIKYVYHKKGWGFLISEDILNPETNQPELIYFKTGSMRLSKNAEKQLKKKQKVIFQVSKNNNLKAKFVHLICDNVKKMSDKKIK